MEMRSAAKIDAYREQAEEQSQKQAEKHENQMAEIRAENAETAKHLRHLTQVIRFLGDKSIEFDGKLRRAGEVFAEGESLAS